MRSAGEMAVVDEDRKRVAAGTEDLGSARSSTWKDIVGLGEAD